MAPAAVAVLAILLAGIPPLTSSQRTRIETARDGRDHREEAFLAMVENMAAWGGEMRDAPVRLNPDLDAMNAAPASYRGELCRLIGTIQQQTNLAPPYAGVCEWFIRNDAGVPVIVFVAAGLDADGASCRDGQRVAIVARYYKPIDDTARDGVSRRYAAFIGAHPIRLGRAPAAGLGRLWLIGIPVAVLLVSFLVLLSITRRGRAARTEPSPSLSEFGAVVDDPRPLPDDPAAALAELDRRARG